MRKGVIQIVGAALTLVVTAASAQAQMGAPSGGSRQSIDKRSAKANTPARPKADDKAYNSALKGLPDKPYDPWHGIH